MNWVIAVIIALSILVGWAAYRMYALESETKKAVQSVLRKMGFI